jgi:hypothetical protein
MGRFNPSVEVSMRSLFSLIAGAVMLMSSAATAGDTFRISAPVDGQERIAGNPWLPWAAALLALLAIILVVADDEDEPESP